MIEPRVIGHMVTRNEKGRYLPASIAWLKELTDGQVHVHDDGSTDGTFEYLVQHVKWATQRPDLATRFAENEGAFRQTAWAEMERLAEPGEQDWILCVDADELLLGDTNPCDTRAVLLDEVTTAVDSKVDSVTFDVAETFSFYEGRPMIRVDGFWGNIRACRLVRWRHGRGLFIPRAAGGSVPASWARSDYVSADLTLLHLGYARREDRLAKYERYSTTHGGHSAQHIDSIMRTPKLKSWSGQNLPMEVPS